MSTPLMLETEVAGNSLTIQRDIPGITVSDPLIEARLTIKVRLSDTDASATQQKSITTSLVVGTGQITQDGSEENGNGTASVFFSFSGTETLALGTLIRYYWDIWCRTASGGTFTSRDPDTDQMVGRLQFKRPVTLAAS